MVGKDCMDVKYIKKNKEMFKDDICFDIYL